MNLRPLVCAVGLAWAGAARAEGLVTLHNLSRHGLMIDCADETAPKPPMQLLRCPDLGRCWPHGWAPGSACWLPPEHAMTFRLEQLESDLDAEIIIRDLDWRTRLGLFGLTIRPVIF